MGVVNILLCVDIYKGAGEHNWHLPLWTGTVNALSVVETQELLEIRKVTEKLLEANTLESRINL